RPFRGLTRSLPLPVLTSLSSYQLSRIISRGFTRIRTRQERSASLCFGQFVSTGPRRFNFGLGLCHGLEVATASKAAVQTFAAREGESAFDGCGAAGRGDFAFERSKVSAAVRMHVVEVTGLRALLVDQVVKAPVGNLR